MISHICALTSSSSYPMLCTCCVDLNERMMDGCIKGSAMQQNIVFHHEEESEVRTATIC